MNMHKNTRLTPYHREEIWRLYTQEKIAVTALAQRFNVSRPTIYKSLKLSRHQLFRPQLSTNERYNKNYPGEMFHVDTKRLPLLKGETKASRREYLFVGIDDYSRELYAGIYHDKSQFSAAAFLAHDVLAQVPLQLNVFIRITDENTKVRLNMLLLIFVEKIGSIKNSLSRLAHKPMARQNE